MTSNAYLFIINVYLRRKHTAGLSMCRICNIFVTFCENNNQQNELCEPENAPSSSSSLKVTNAHSQFIISFALNKQRKRNKNLFNLSLPLHWSLQHNLKERNGKKIRYSQRNRNRQSMRHVYIHSLAHTHTTINVSMYR